MSLAPCPHPWGDLTHHPGSWKEAQPVDSMQENIWSHSPSSPGIGQPDPLPTQMELPRMPGEETRDLTPGNGLICGRRGVLRSKERTQLDNAFGPLLRGEENAEVQELHPSERNPNLGCARHLLSQGEHLQEMRCKSQWHPHPEVSSLQVAPPSHATPQSPQPLLSQGPRIGNPTPPRLSSPLTQDERMRARAGTGPGRIFTDCTPRPGATRSSSPFPAPSTRSGGDALAGAGTKSQIQAPEAKAAVPPGGKKTAGGWRMRCAGISPRTLAIFCSPFRKVPLYLSPLRRCRARPRAQLRASFLRPRPHTPSTAYRPLLSPRGPRGYLLKPARLLRASSEASREWREATQPECPRGKSGRRRPLFQRLPHRTEGVPGLHGSEPLPASAPPLCALCGPGSRIEGHRVVGRRRAARFSPRGPGLALAEPLREGYPSFFLALARSPGASRSLGSSWSWRSPPQLFPWLGPVSPAPRSTPPRGPRQPPNRGRGWVPSSCTPPRALGLVRPGRRAP
nr:nascent polypeptide-associated complex subunit alpha, muscle-specific form-like [Aotus nancymaae]